MLGGGGGVFNGGVGVGGVGGALTDGATWVWWWSANAVGCALTGGATRVWWWLLVAHSQRVPLGSNDGSLLLVPPSHLGLNGDPWGSIHGGGHPLGVRPWGVHPWGLHPTHMGTHPLGTSIGDPSMGVPYIRLVRNFLRLPAARGGGCVARGKIAW